jgi:aspartate/methionine/tyrosine aminotransferase
MPLRFARRVSECQPFLAMEIMERARELERGGKSVLHLELGEPDFAPPPAAVAACQAALALGETRYTDSRGLPELREAIASDLTRRAGVSIAAERVLVTSGTSPAWLLALSLLVEPGDEVLLGTPHYPCYPNFIRQLGGVPVFVPTRAESGWQLDPEAVAAARTPRTRAIVVASPANPTGAVESAETLRALAALGLPLLSDEIYDGLLYDGARVTSALAVSEQAFALDGFSKRYAMTGFRLGWVAAPREALRALQVLQQNLFISANHFVQRAGIAALRQGAETPRAMCAAYARRRDRLADGLRRIGFELPRLPRGAFYLFADARRFTSDSLAFARALLERAGVAVTPGIDFGATGEGWLRFCYAAPEAVLDEALARIERTLPELAERGSAA